MGSGKSGFAPSRVFTLASRCAAEREGFEPPVPFGTPLFESGTINHSDTSPLEEYHATGPQEVRFPLRRDDHDGADLAPPRHPRPVGKILGSYVAAYVIFATNVSHAIVGAWLATALTTV